MTRHYDHRIITTRHHDHRIVGTRHHDHRIIGTRHYDHRIIATHHYDHLSDLRKLLRGLDTDTRRPQMTNNGGGDQ
eukprot:924596-Prorocentrum_minimum.AAC.1